MPAKRKKQPQQTAAEAERRQQEFEELRKKLRAETEADMVVLRALMDIENQARGLEQAAEDYSVGVEWRVTESEREIDAAEREAVRRETQAESDAAAKRADEQIAAIRAETEKKREDIRARFAEHKSEYVERVFAMVTGAQDE